MKSTQSTRSSSLNFSSKTRLGFECRGVCRFPGGPRFSGEKFAGEQWRCRSWRGSWNYWRTSSASTSNKWYWGYNGYSKHKYWDCFDTDVSHVNIRLPRKCHARNRKTVKRLISLVSALSAHQRSNGLSHLPCGTARSYLLSVFNPALIRTVYEWTRGTSFLTSQPKLLQFRKGQLSGVSHGWMRRVEKQPEPARLWEIRFGPKWKSR